MAYGMTSQYDIMMSGHVTSHNEFVCISQSITKKGTVGQKVSSIWETREVRERSGVFISLKYFHENLSKFAGLE